MTVWKICHNSRWHACKRFSCTHSLRTRVTRRNNSSIRLLRRLFRFAWRVATNYRIISHRWRSRLINLSTDSIYASASNQLLHSCKSIHSPVCVLWWALRCELLVYTFLHPGNWHLCILRFVSGGLCSLLLAWCLLATVVVAAVVPACVCCVPATAGKPFAVTEISLQKKNRDSLPLIGCISLVIISRPLRDTMDVPGSRFQPWNGWPVRVTVRFLDEFNARKPESSVIGRTTSNRRTSRASKETRANREERDSGDRLMMDCENELFYAS